VINQGDWYRYNIIIDINSGTVEEYCNIFGIIVSLFQLFLFISRLPVAILAINASQSQQRKFHRDVGRLAIGKRLNFDLPLVVSTHSKKTIIKKTAFSCATGSMVYPE
jgi:hypothetical protein